MSNISYIFPRKEDGSIDDSTPVASFTASGREYFIETQMTVARYRQYSSQVVSVQYGCTPESIFDKLKDIWDQCDKGRVATANVMIHNLMSSVASIADRKLHVMRLCAMFCNTHDEDRGNLTEGMISKKIQEWEKSNICINDFFLLALGSIPALREELMRFLESPADYGLPQGFSIFPKSVKK